MLQSETSQTSNNVVRSIFFFLKLFLIFYSFEGSKRFRKIRVPSSILGQNRNSFSVKFA